MIIAVICFEKGKVKSGHPVAALLEFISLFYPNPCPLDNHPGVKHSDSTAGMFLSKVIHLLCQHSVCPSRGGDKAISELLLGSFSSPEKINLREKWFKRVHAWVGQLCFWNLCWGSNIVQEDRCSLHGGQEVETHRSRYRTCWRSHPWSPSPQQFYVLTFLLLWTYQWVNLVM